MATTQVANLHRAFNPVRAGIMSNLNNFVQGIHNDGGATYNLNTGEFNPTNGYIVGLKGTQVKSTYNPLTTDDEVKSYIAKFGSELTSTDNSIGAWVEDGELYLDVVIKITDEQQALNTAIANSQIAYYDCANRQSVYVKRTPRNSGIWGVFQ